MQFLVSITNHRVSHTMTLCRTIFFKIGADAYLQIKMVAFHLLITLGNFKHSQPRKRCDFERYLKRALKEVRGIL